VESVNILSDPTITLIIGAFVGFLFAISKDIINNSIKTKKEQTLKHLNDIFVLISKHGSFTNKTLTSLFNQEHKREKYDDITARLSFLIRVYFPHIEKIYQEYLSQATDFGVYQLSLFHKITVDELQSTVCSLEYRNKSTEFNNSYRIICTLIVDESRKV